MVSYVRASALLIVGVVLGLFGVTLFSRGLKAEASAESQKLASACIPDEQSQDIFFVSCGGIY